jgi:hypothetical protein
VENLPLDLAINGPGTRYGNSSILYADAQVLITKPEDELLIAAHRLNKFTKKYNLKISTSRTRSMGMCGNEI